MREDIVEQVLREVRRRQHCALLIGRPPSRDLGWEYVTEGEYEAVVIGSLSPRELLFFPDEACMQALLTGKPVFLWEEGLEYRRYAKTANRALYSKLLGAERQLKQIVLPDLLCFVDRHIIVAHNCAFDYKFLAQSCMRYRFKIPHRWVDSMDLKKYYPEIKSRKLQSFLSAAGISNDDAHRALSDAEALAKLMIVSADRVRPMEES